MKDKVQNLLDALTPLQTWFEEEFSDKADEGYSLIGVRPDGANGVVFYITNEDEDEIHIAAYQYDDQGELVPICGDPDEDES